MRIFDKNFERLQEGTDLLARAFCHELDHLDGILFIDKILPDTTVNNIEQ